MLKTIRKGANFCFAILILILLFTVNKASAVTEDIFTYNIVENQCYITACDNNISGVLEVPDTIEGAVVVSIGSGVFKGKTSLTGIVLPETVKVVGDDAFRGCSNLSYAVIPDSVTSVGNSIFYKCINLKSVKLPSGIQILPENTFYYCEKLESVTLPESLTTIGIKSFYNCKSLKEIVLPETTMNIYQSAFEECTSLSKIYIPSGILEIGKDAFRNCNSLSMVYFGGGSDFSEDFSIYTGNEILTDIDWNFAHTHSAVSDFLVVEPTCIDSGYTEFICQCGFSGKDNFTSSLGHDLSRLTVVNTPDCTNTGLAKVGCSRCDYLEDMILETTGHKIVIDPETEATCFEDGKTSGSHCYFCGEIFEEQVTIGALGHNFTRRVMDKAHMVSPATYGKNALYCYTCTRCSAVSDDTFVGEKLILGKPAQFISSSTSNSITLSWSKVTDADGYGIYYKGAGKWKLYKKVADNKLTISSIASGNTYDFAVRAYVVEDGKIIASPYYQTLKEATKPGRTSKIVAKQNENAIKISWNVVKGATGYRVYGYNSKSKSWVVVRSSTTTCSNITENLRSGVFYKFAVKAYIDLGSKIVWSESYTEIITSTKPVAPILKATSLAGSIRFEWNKVNGADGYIIYGSKRSDSGYVRLKVTTGLTCTVTGLERAQTYYFKAYSVKKVNGGYIYSYAGDIKVAKTK